MEFIVELEGCIVISGDVAPETHASVVEEHLDLVMEELLNLDAVDPAISLDTSDNSVVLSVAVTAPNPIEAVNTGSAQLRTAIHAAGGGTPDWPDVHSEAWGITLLSSKSTPARDAQHEDRPLANA